MHFDHDSVCSGSSRRRCDRSDQRGNACSVAWISDDRQMGPLLQKRDRINIESKSCCGFKGADSPFAKDYIGIPVF